MNKIIVCTYDEKLLPVKMTPWAVCFDMFCEEDFEIDPGEVKKSPHELKLIFQLVGIHLFMLEVVYLLRHDLWRLILLL